ncbi:SAM-dependent methyltransferase [Actinomadura rubrisoli]|uniref:SAM-dependent methyltransferase n=1 Tax=Actinomadura rubrisoli TaxID=2530368 RepID=UPI0014050D07|nr:SAM-dependent methyltransferase [Actinomadura rubrisoli]
MTRGSVLSLRQWAAASPSEEEAAVRAGVGATAPSVARLGDYLLGGKDNYAADRDLAERALAEAPVMSRLVQAERAFLDHAAGRLAEAGLRQFLHLGCGLPVLGPPGAVSGNVAGIVRRTDPSCRVAYVDDDPMVVCHARALLAVDGGTRAICADPREPAALLAHPELRQVIDLERPVGVLLIGVLHFIADDPRGVVHALLDGLPAGSHVAITHMERTPGLDAAARLLREAGVPFTPRSRDEVIAICGDLEMVGPYPANLPVADCTRPAAAVGAAGIIGPMPLVGCIGRKPE